MRAQVLSILNQRLGNETTASDVARQLNVSERSLRRRLAAEQCNFQQLLTESRMTLAMDYLEHSNMSAKEVGFLIGFKDANSFYRAFQQWTGNTVLAWRRARHGTPLQKFS